MRIHLANDHAAGDLRAALITWLEERNHEIVDHGTPDGGSVDYPDHAHPLALGVAEGDGLGILICGSANGVAMTANKHAGHCPIGKGAQQCQRALSPCAVHRHCRCIGLRGDVFEHGV